MKTTLWLVGLVVIALSSGVSAQNEKRLVIKCFLQIEDKTNIIHHFVTNEQDKKNDIDNLVGQHVFMPDGISKQQIIDVYECIDMNQRFSQQEALKIERNTPF